MMMMRPSQVSESQTHKSNAIYMTICYIYGGRYLGFDGGRVIYDSAPVNIWKMGIQLVAQGW